MKGKKILLVHLEANGDCLMVTTIARQLRKDNPEAHITWAIGERCRQVILHNPYVDEVWPVAYAKDEYPPDLWARVKKMVRQKIQEGIFDEVLYTQIHVDNLHHYDGTTRSSTFRAYPGKITVPVSPVIVLSDQEVERVKTFAERYSLTSYKKVILVECAPSSGQSNFNMETALLVGLRLVEENKDMVYIMSTHISFQSPHERIIDGSSLTYRENAELSKYCTFLLGCSSGITWLLTSEWAKKIPTVQILNGEATFFQFASVKYDFEYWKLDHQHIIESTKADVAGICEMVSAALSDFKKAALVYNENLSPKISALHYNMESHLRRKEIQKALKTFLYFVGRNNNKVGIIYKVMVHLSGLLFAKAGGSGR